MFDLRYHVASLAAVFLALVIGILVGVGLSGRGFVDDAERKNLTSQITELRSERDTIAATLEAEQHKGDALDDYAGASYLPLVHNRLKDTPIAVVYVGSVDQSVGRSIRKAVEDAGGKLQRVRALRVPLDGEAIDQALGATPATRTLVGADRREELGRQLGRELVAGGATPLWDALEGILVEERSGALRPPVGGVVVARPAGPQQGETLAFLTGFYRGLAQSKHPAVGADPVKRRVPAVPVFRRAGLSTVDAVDTDIGRLALVLLLAGAEPGSYGLEKDAVDGVVPAISTLSPAASAG